ATFAGQSLDQSCKLQADTKKGPGASRKPAEALTKESEPSMTHPPANTATLAPPMEEAEVLPFYTPEEVGKMLRIGRSRIYEELRRCRLRSIKVGRSRRIPAEW